MTEKTLQDHRITGSYNFTICCMLLVFIWSGVTWYMEEHLFDSRAEEWMMSHSKRFSIDNEFRLCYDDSLEDSLHHSLGCTIEPILRGRGWKNECACVETQTIERAQLTREWCESLSVVDGYGRHCYLSEDEFCDMITAKAYCPPYSQCHPTGESSCYDCIDCSKISINEVRVWNETVCIGGWDCELKMHYDECLPNATCLLLDGTKEGD